MLNKKEIRVYKRFEEILSFRAVMLHNSLQFEFEGNKARKLKKARNYSAAKIYKLFRSSTGIVVQTQNFKISIPKLQINETNFNVGLCHSLFE